MEDYYYITFISPIAGLGNVMLRHVPHPDGFNIASAHKYLEELTGVPVIIMSWYQVTKRRYEEFAAYTQKFHHQPDCPHYSGRVGLTILQGEKQGEPGKTPAGVLKAVDFPKEPPPQSPSPCDPTPEQD